MATMYRDPLVPAPAGPYIVALTSAPPALLLPGHHPIWTDAEAIGWGPEPYRTTFRAVWNAGGIAIRFDACDRDPWHTMRRHKDPIAREEVVEIFLDPARSGRNYAEIEVSPFNIVTDLRVVEPWPNLTGDRDWSWTGLESTVVPGACGGLQADSWIAVVWLPWEGLRTLSADATERVPPRAGDRWRFNVFRIKRPHGPTEPERDAVYAAWSVPSGPSFHDPAAFRELVFAQN
ncbi:MAG: carbohydrate-binding family 9-like protein [Acidobacteriota bacterium]